MFEFYFVDEMLGEQGSMKNLFEKLLPVLTLILGILLNRGFGWFDRRRQNRKQSNDLLTEIQLLDEPVKRQVEIVDELVATLKERKYSTIKFTSINSLKMDRMMVKDRASVVDYFERMMGSRQEALDIANKLFNGCDVLTHYYELMKQIMLDHVERSSVAWRQWRASLNRMLKAQANMVAAAERAGIDPSQDPLLGRIIELTHDIKQVERDLFVMLDTIHRPLMTHLAENRLDPRVEVLADLNGEACQAILEIEHLKIEAAFKMNASKEGVVKQHATFKTLLAQLKFVKP